MASDFDPRFDPAFQRGFDGPVVGRGATPSRRVEFTPSTRVEPVETSPPMDLPTLRGNPFIPALWITAAVFTIAGAASQYVATFLNYSPTASSAAVEYVLPAVLVALSPWLFAAGLALGIATLVVHALRWRPAG